MSGDGRLAACRRIELGCWWSKTDKDGAAYYLYRIDGTAPPPPAPVRARGRERAGPDLSHRAYTGLLAGLVLSDPHRQALRDRGLGDEDIARRGYRSLKVRGRARLARELREQLGDVLLSVPGFFVREGDGDRPYVTLAGAAGLLVPVRDIAGRIVALLVRRDEAGDGQGKYSYLSSTKHGGPGPGAPPHTPLGVTAPAQVVRITEGTLKADVAFSLSGLPTVGAAGLSWRPALDRARGLGARTVRLALDADAWANAHVARALADCAAGAAAAGLGVELERWRPEDGKGIDDLLAAGKEAEVLSGKAALAAIRRALAPKAHGQPSTPTGRGRHRLDTISFSFRLEVAR